MKWIDVHSHNFAATPSHFTIYVQSLNSFNPVLHNYCLGLHPWDRNKISLTEWQQKFAHYLKTPECVGVGEVGLDKLKTHLPGDQDYLDYFFQQSYQLQKPLILHIVKSYPELSAYLKKCKFITTILIHAFSGPSSFLKQHADLPIFYSLGPRELKRAAKDDAFKKLLLPKLLLETDDSGYSIVDTYHLAADYFQMDLQQLQLLINRNFQQLFPKVKL